MPILLLSGCLPFIACSCCFQRICLYLSSSHENVLWLGGFIKPLSFCTEYTKPSHTRNFMTNFMLQMIMTVQHPIQCTDSLWLCFLGSSSWFLVAMGWSSFSMVLPATSCTTRNWWEKAEETREADEEALIVCYMSMLHISIKIIILVVRSLCISDRVTYFL